MTVRNRVARLERRHPADDQWSGPWRRQIVDNAEELAEAERRAAELFAAQGVRTIIRTIIDPQIRQETNR